MPSLMTSFGSRSDVSDWVAPFIRRPRRASSAESRTWPSRVSRSRWMVTETTTDTAVHRTRRRRLVASLLCTATPATVRLTMEAAMTTTAYELG